MNENVKDLKEKLRIAEANGDTKTAQEIRAKLQQMTVNG